MIVASVHAVQVQTDSYVDEEVTSSFIRLPQESRQEQILSYRCSSNYLESGCHFFCDG